jgi:hypothetical protein
MFSTAKEMGMISWGQAFPRIKNYFSAFLTKVTIQRTAFVR